MLPQTSNSDVFYQMKTPSRHPSNQIQMQGPYSDRIKSPLSSEQSSYNPHLQSATQLQGHYSQYLGGKQTQSINKKQPKQPYARNNNVIFDSPIEGYYTSQPHTTQNAADSLYSNLTPNIKLRNEIQYFNTNQPLKNEYGSLARPNQRSDKCSNDGKSRQQRQTLESSIETRKPQQIIPHGVHLMNEYQSSSTLPSNSLPIQLSPPSSATNKQLLLNNSNHSQTTAKAFQFNENPPTMSTISYSYEAVNRTILLIKTLCQTYQKDKVFAQSILKLVNELKDEINQPNTQEVKLQEHNVANLITKIQELEKKKKYYKQMAKTMKTEILDLKKSQKIFRDMQELLKEKDSFIQTLRKRNEQIERELSGQRAQKNNEAISKKNALKQVSISNNNDFQELVKECDKYIFETSANLDSSGRIEQTQDNLDKVRSQRIKIKEKSKEETVSVDSMKEMKDKLFKEITEQLDSKMTLKIQQTLEQQSNISDQTINKSGPVIHFSKEEIHKEIMQILQEQQILSAHLQSTDNTLNLNKNPSSSQFHKNCGHQQQNAHNISGPSSASKNNQTSDMKKPSIRPKNPNSTQKTINRGADTTIDKSDISDTLHKNKSKNSFIIGCDGDAVILHENPDMSKKKIDLNKKLAIAEERLLELHKTNNHEKSASKQFEKPVEKVKEEMPFKSINDQLLEMANNQDFDDEMLLSDQDIKNSFRQNQTFGKKGPKDKGSPSKPISGYKKTNELSNMKKNNLKQISTVSSNPNLSMNDHIEGKQTITPKEQQSKEFNRFGFRNRSSSKPQ